MIGVFRVYGNYHCSPVRFYLEDNKISAELVGSDWVVIEYENTEQIHQILDKVLEVKGAERKFVNLGRYLKQVDKTEVKSADSSFKTHHHKEYSESFLRGFVYVSNLLLQERLRVKETVDGRLFSL